MLEQAALDTIIKRIVEIAAPEKIILFGSSARGDFGRNSDVDLLIVKDGEDALTLMSRICGEMQGMGAAVDALVVSSDDVERYKDSHSLIIKPALQDVVWSCMSLRKRFPPDDPREWLNRARSNLALAKSRIPDAYLEDLCFEAQQAAEKAIKARLIALNIEFPYVPDLARLLSLFDEAGEPVPEAVRKSAALTPTLCSRGILHLPAR